MIILAVVLLVAAACAVLFFTGVIGGEKPPEDAAHAPAQEWLAPKATAAANTPTTQSTPAPTMTAAAAVPDAPPAITQAPVYTQAPAITQAPAAPQAPAQMDATGTPAPEDFTWFTDKAAGWAFGDMPSDARLLGTSAAIAGSWKGMEMIYDYDGTVLGCGYFTLTFDASSTDVNVTATLSWHFMDWSDGAREDISSWQDDVLSGFFEVPTFAVGVPGNSIELYCYELNGRQYAEGIWTVQSGEEVRVALVRP